MANRTPVPIPLKWEEGMQSEEGRILGDVCLICPVYNEAESIGQFLVSVFSMTALPLEMVIVDGGSSDGTPDVIKAHVAHAHIPTKVRLIVDPSSNRKSSRGPIARARNTAIKATQCDIVACTDAGCVLAHDWLDVITAPLREDRTVCAVGGWYKPHASTFFERLVGDAWVVQPELVDPSTFLPSSRSLAFRREVWEKAGGYPEISYTGEDTAYVMKLRALGCSIVYRKTALVYWHMRSNVVSLIAMIFLYGHGDGVNRLLLSNMVRNFIKVLFPCILLAFSVLVSTVFLVPLAGYLLFIPFLRQPTRALRLNNLLRFPALGVVKLLTDASYVVGYVYGRLSIGYNSLRGN